MPNRADVDLPFLLRSCLVGGLSGRAARPARIDNYDNDDDVETPDFEGSRAACDDENL